MSFKSIDNFDRFKSLSSEREEFIEGPKENSEKEVLINNEPKIEPVSEEKVTPFYEKRPLQLGALAVSVLIAYDTSLKLIFLLLSSIYPGYMTYISLINCKEFEEWTFYWVILGVIKVIEIPLEYTFMYITLGYYYYIKLIFLIYLLKDINHSKNLFDKLQNKTSIKAELITWISDLEAKITSYLKNIKNMNKQFSL